MSYPQSKSNELTEQRDIGTIELIAVTGVKEGVPIDPSYKSHIASNKYPTKHKKGCIAGYWIGALWDLWGRLLFGQMDGCKVHFTRGQFWSWGIIIACVCVCVSITSLSAR